MHLKGVGAFKCQILAFRVLGLCMIKLKFMFDLKDNVGWIYADEWFVDMECNYSWFHQDIQVSPFPVKDGKEIIQGDE